MDSVQEDQLNDFDQYNKSSQGSFVKEYEQQISDIKKSAHSNNSKTYNNFLLTEKINFKSVSTSLNN